MSTPMSTPKSMQMPPQLEAARAQIEAILEQIEGKKVDLIASRWADIEKSLIKLLKGPFRMNQAEHQVAALGLAAALGERLHTECQAFWFPSRESPEGASLGFPDALIMLSPFGAVVDALRSARLEKLDEVIKDVRTSLAKVKFSATNAAPVRLGPEDYMRLFDPGFVQLVALDPAKTKELWMAKPPKISADLRDAIARAAQLPQDVKRQLEQQLAGALTRLDPATPLINQVAKAPRVVETMALIFAGVGSTGAASEEIWGDVVMPLLFIGAPQQFPPLDAEELKAAKEGVHPFFLYIDVVPYQFKAPEEDGLLGAFSADSLGLPDPAFEEIPHLRLIKVGIDGIKSALADFDAKKSREAIERFGAEVRGKTGPVAVTQGESEAKLMLDAAMTLLTDLKALAAQGKDLYVRRLTEAEAASEPALAQVRKAASGPRIILAS